MADHALFYDSVDHDRVYDANSFSDWLKKFFTNGVFTGDLFVSALTGMNVSVGSGYVNIGGKVMIFDAPTVLTLDPANGIYPRIDTIVVERNDTDRDITLKVVTGDYANLNDPIPTPPERSGAVYQLVLAQIYVGAGVTEITQANITDTRADADLCGIVTGTVTEMDFSQFSAQFRAYYNEFKNGYETDFRNWAEQQELDFTNWSTQQETNFTNWMNAEKADFDDWFANLHYVLDGDVAGHLQNEIDEIQEGLAGSMFAIHTVNASLYGKTVTMTGATQTKTAVFDNNGDAVIKGVTDIGTLTFTATDGNETATTVISIPYFGNYPITMAFWAATVNLTTTSAELFGKTVVVRKGASIVASVAFSAMGTAVYTASSAGTYTFSINYEGDTISETVNITEETTYNVSLELWSATIEITTSSVELYGETITVTDSNDQIVGTVDFDNAGEATFRVHKADTYTLTVTYGGEDYTAEVVVTAETTYTATIDTIPDGSTVLPTDDIQTWLACAGIKDKSYTTLAEVLADTDTLQRLINDENAIDYLVRSTTWADDITADATAMSYIGAKNYAADTLLGDEDWNEAICESEYFESVLNVKVPTMTSDTAPKGRVIYSAQNSTYTAVRAFNATKNWSTGAGVTKPTYIGYIFDTATVLKYVKTTEYGYSSGGMINNFKIQGSNDTTNGSDGTWTDLTDTITITSAGASTPHNFVINNSTAYKAYRLFAANETSGSIETLQFYGREDVTEGINVYSAANDTVYYMDNGTPVTVCTTDATGHAFVDPSDLPAGTYTLYSSVAKDPDNLSNDYSKQVTVFDGMIEIKLMPDNALYWFGWQGDIEQPISANGWSGYTKSGATFNTQSISLAGDQSPAVGIASKNPTICSKVKSILSHGTGATYYSKPTLVTTKTYATNSDNIGSSSMTLYEYSSTEDNYYVSVGNYVNANALTIHAIWVE